MEVMSKSGQIINKYFCDDTSIYIIGDIGGGRDNTGSKYLPNGIRVF